VLGQTRDATAATQEFNVLTGLAALDTGIIIPGGVVERIDKLPDADRIGLAAGYYSESVTDFAADLSRTFRGHGLRLNVADERGAWIVPGTRYATSQASATIAAALTSRATLIASIEGSRSWERGEQASLYLNGHGVPAAPDGKTLLGQTWDGTEGHDYIGSLRLGWQLDERWRLFAGALRLQTRNDDVTFDGLLQGGDRYEARYLRDPSQRFVSDTLHGELEGDLSAFGWRHKLRFGATHAVYRAYRSGTQIATLGPSSIAAPTAFDAVDLLPAGAPFEAQHLQNRGWFVSDSMMPSERLTLVVGLRGGNYRETGANVTEPADERYLLKSFGVRFQVSPRLTVYASGGEALELGGTAPLASTNAERVLPAYISRQLEAGLGYALTERLGVEAALFEARRRYEYEDSAGLYRQDGTVEHRGLELKAVGTLGRLRVYANVLALDPRVRGASDPAVDGRIPVNVARLRGTLIVESDLPWRGWSASMQLEAFGARTGDATNTARVPGYAVLGAGLRFARDDWLRGAAIRLDIENLADRAYWEDVEAGYLYPSGPRAVFLRLSLEI